MFKIKVPALKNIKINQIAVFQYIFILCMILNFRSIWLHTETLAWLSHLIKLLMGLSVVGGVFAVRKISSKKISRCVMAVVIMALYVGVWFLLDPLKRSGIIAVQLQLLAIIVYCFLVETSFDDTMRKFTNIVIVIAVVSLFFWVFGSLLGYIKPTGYIETTWTGNTLLKKAPSYFGIYFETQSATMFGFLSSYIRRNTAIFTEAPMASMVFSTAFLYELLMKDELNRKRCFILIAAVLSTISTTGITVVIIAIGFRYIFSESKTRGSISLKVILLPSVFIIGLIMLDYLVKQKLGTSSGSTRVDDFIAGYKAWMDAPLFGNGYNNAASMQQYMSSFRSNNLGFSNSPMQILSFGGIYLFLPYLLSAIKGIARLVSEHDWRRTAFYLVFLYEFTITVCSFQMLTFYLFITMAREGGSKLAKIPSLRKIAQA